MIHDPVQGIQYPVPAGGVFAVVNVRGFQYKVVQDDVLVLQHLQGVDIGEQVVLDQVQMVGSKDYTALGRPWVESAKVFATVEQQTLSEKVIVFKKKRRQNYKKNNSSEAKLTVLRIDSIEHQLDQALLQRAVPLL